MRETLPALELVTLSSHDYHQELADDVARGLRSEPKSIPSKYFYDARGGALFDRITELPEYYLTRAEMALLAKHARDIIGFAAPAEMLELGSGSADKTSLLLDAAGAHRVSSYASLDVNRAALSALGRTLRARYPDLSVTGLVGDFVSDLAMVPSAEGRRLIQFFGSTIGNLTGGLRSSFLSDVARLMSRRDTFLLGVDLVKDVETMKAAYDDSQGLTAEFTCNVLQVVNRELEADFPVDAFEHVPVWNAAERRMEAWLEASRAMDLRVGQLDLGVSLDAGERIHTEVSCKFTEEMVADEFAQAGLAVSRWYTDERRTFALALGTHA